MAVRQVKCARCDSTKLKVYKEINPETTDMNMKVKMECSDCGHKDTYRVTSYHHNRQRKRGLVI